MSWFKKIFCRHRAALGFVRNIHGDEINHYGGKRSEWFCPDCQSFVWMDHLHMPEVIGALNDMRVRKDAAYLERNQVVAALAAAFPSGTARTAIEGWSEDWHGCVYIDLPTGQASWHYHDSQAHLFAHLPPYAGQWDGHSTDEKYRRLAALATAAPEVAAPAETPAARDVLAERRRQVQAEGYTPQHDAGHGAAELAAAAGCYALLADTYPNPGQAPKCWPWDAASWKPKDFRRDLVRAGALALAAIEENDRATQAACQTAYPPSNWGPADAIAELMGHSPERRT